MLSAGGGEFILNEGTPQQVANNPQDTHYDAQVFSPPYLFKGPRPQITSAPDSVNYGDTFEIGTAQPEQIATISLVRLSSVTHSFNAGQRINFLPSQVAGGTLTATAPPNANVCPPGHYMLFIVNLQGVPSVATIVQVSAPAAAAAQLREAAKPEAAAVGASAAADAQTPSPCGPRYAPRPAAPASWPVSRESARMASRPAGEARTRRCAALRECSLLTQSPMGTAQQRLSTWKTMGCPHWITGMINSGGWSTRPMSCAGSR